MICTREALVRRGEEPIRRVCEVEIVWLSRRRKSLTEVE